MILIDANLLIYAHVHGQPQHARARQWLDETLNTAPRVGLPWASILAFVRIVTNPRVFTHPESVSNAWTQVKSWLSVDSVWIPLPGERHARLLEPLLEHASSGGNLISDAHVAALALEHGLTICSTDTDFARFPGLAWKNPLR